MGRTRSTQYGKRAGNAFEREVAKKIGKQFGIDSNNIMRTPSSGGMKIQKFKGDIVVLEQSFPLHVEAKFGYDFDLQDILKKKYIDDFVAQAKRDVIASGNTTKIPIVVISKPYYDRYVIVPIENVLLTPEVTQPALQDLKLFMLTEKYLVILLDDLKKAVEINLIKCY